MDNNRHRYVMLSVLGDIYSDDILSKELCFKGGTAAYFFEGLHRFSTDLDFNLRNRDNEAIVHKRIQGIALHYGDIVDSAVKHFGPIVVVSYAKGERNLKIEVSNRLYDNHYSPRSFLSRTVPVMTKPDMFSHKLCAMLERQAPRDVYDCWFFASSGTPVNPHILYERTGLGVSEFLSRCADRVAPISSKYLMAGFGDVLLDTPGKDFVRNRLLSDAEIRLRAMAESPIVSDSEPLTRTKLLELDGGLIGELLKRRIDVASISERDLFEGFRSGNLSARDSSGVTCSIPLPGIPISDFLRVFKKVSEEHDGIRIVTRDDGKVNYITEDKRLVTDGWLDEAQPFKCGLAECTFDGVKIKINTSGIIQNIISHGRSEYIPIGLRR